MTADRGTGAATVGSPSVGGRDRCWPTPDNTMFPLPVRIEDCCPVGEELSRRITAALLEVGGQEAAGVWWAGDGDMARAQQLALESLRIEYVMVPLSEYRDALVSQFPERPAEGSHGIGCRDSWWTA